MEEWKEKIQEEDRDKPIDLNPWSSSSFTSCFFICRYCQPSERQTITQPVRISLHEQEKQMLTRLARNRRRICTKGRR